MPFVAGVSRAAAKRLHRAFSRVLNTNAWRLQLWDGTVVTGGGVARFDVSLRSRRALDVFLGGPPERAFGRAYVAGDLDVEPPEPFLEAMARTRASKLLAGWAQTVAAAIELGARPSAGDPGDAQARLHGRRHSRERDAAAIRHHYDLPPEFYALWLDRTLTYSCAYFESPDTDIDTAQQAKLDLVCRKLRLQPGERLLDVGCGWGSLLLHAAQHYGVSGVGITLSPRQVEYAQDRARALGLSSRAEFRLADYRDPSSEQYDAIASVGMIEHVGRNLLSTYAASIYRRLRPGGRALVHGISNKPRTHLNRASFINTFVFPDGELEDVASVVRTLEDAGLEVRDTESLREHYALTLRQWVARLDRNWDEAVRIAGVKRARVWRLYMLGSIVCFRAGSVSIHQTLAVRATEQGAANLPLTRADWYARPAQATTASNGAAAAQQPLQPQAASR
jgi:cyclopropane-fatty-acyl-phospholipid synthase